MSNPAIPEPYRRELRAVVMADMVESVRLIELDEEGTVRRWRNYVDQVAAQDLPASKGRLVKNLGDGMLLEFESAPQAVRCAFAMQARLAQAEADLDISRRMRLRIGVHLADVIAEQQDLYGKGVNLSARLTTLAGPGEVVGSVAVRDRLTPGLDCEFDDLGECELKNLPQPVRAFRLSPPGAVPTPLLIPGGAFDIRPSVAVIPFRSRTADARYQFLGEALADEVTAALSHLPELMVISRLSAAVFRDRDLGAGKVGALLGVRYLLSGSYQTDGEQVRTQVELAETRRGQVVWSTLLKGDAHELFAMQDEFVREIVRGMGAAVMAAELRRSRQAPWQDLDGYALMLRSIEQMHRVSRNEFEVAHQMLLRVVERSPHLPAPRAWLAKWHVLRVAQGWSPQPQADARQAHEQVDRALQSDPGNSLALAVDGLAAGYISKDLGAAGECYRAALESNPNESLAWLFSSTLNAWRGDGEQAVMCAERALALSPLDPLKYFFDSLAGTAVLAGGHYERAIELSQRSLRQKRRHTSTLRTQAVAQSRAGRMPEARQTVGSLLALEPDLTVGRFRERYPGRAAPHAERYCEALSAAGMPN